MCVFVYVCIVGEGVAQFHHFCLCCCSIKSVHGDNEYGPTALLPAVKTESKCGPNRIFFGSYVTLINHMEPNLYPFHMWS